jgi:hypothetical protein
LVDHTKILRSIVVNLAAHLHGVSSPGNLLASWMSCMENLREIRGMISIDVLPHAAVETLMQLTDTNRRAT